MSFKQSEIFKENAGLDTVKRYFALRPWEDSFIGFVLTCNQHKMLPFCENVKIKDIRNMLVLDGHVNR